VDASLQNTQGTYQPDGLLSGKIYAGKIKYAYDIAAGKWSKVILPEGGFDFTSLVMFRKDAMYFFLNQSIGGNSGVGQPLPPWRPSIRSYDPTAGNWKALLPVTASAKGLVPVAIGDRVFMITEQFEAPMQIFEYFFL
jgi:hypothetical protein